jgi:TolB-like protein/DNA-binding winged helix-turn-helix (wHTH) protein/Flp pilus assembly protein TadD
MPIYRFRNCFLNTTERRVIKNGKYLELTPKTFDVLQLLVEKWGEIMTKDEILSKVWNGSFVEEGNLPVHISKLRRLLDETKNEPFIETVQGSGYRFISPVQSVSENSWERNLSDKNHLPNHIISEGFIFDSIAVLPLQNESNNLEIDYLADGLTESFINSLSRVSNLKVIARNTVFRYKNKEVDAQEISKTLGVAAVLSGRIRAIKDRLSISVELTKVEDGTQLWGTQFNQPFSDIIEVQEKITSALSEKLNTQISARNSVANPITQNSESYRLYLKGKYFLEKRTEKDIYKAIECYQKSVSLDPTNVYSYVEIIECYFLLHLWDYVSYTDVSIKIKPLLSVVSKLNQNVDVVQAMYGGIKMHLEWNFEEAEKHFHNALTINPNCLIARNRYSHLLLYSRRFPEALKELKQIMLIDPLSVTAYQRIGKIFYLMSRFENAISYLKDALELESTDYLALVLLGATLTELDKYEEASTIFQKSLRIQYNTETLSMIGYVNARAGRKHKAYQIIKQIESQSKSNCHHAIKLARIYFALGEKETAYEFLDRAFEQREMDLIGLKSDPRWARIRHEPRFRELIRRVGLPIN